ncbi:AraC family transcriptional regulator [Flavobacterium cupreum]|uniref:AraC family transcriptional regulator n=2 Tax=Flavobacterium TaxID=237 RepID=A0A4Y7UG01_9FLAO|nr:MULTISPECIES: AraC family transcriptional regulator [Flavobacterium]RUT67920.1 AraC family transcriptional regulator [Flavobacterium cupreum]TCN59480.1 AraC-like DNA-binding protein [Flavobacterium circumlabens]TEB44779.1 AraC family transcriptional regulator [Flavobacterium circumlabens]
MNKIFHIFKVDELEAKKISDQPDAPHNHDFEELLIGLNGGLEHFIDFNSTKTLAPFVSFITKGKMHRIIPSIYNGECDIWVIRFKSEFIPETTFQLYSLYHKQANLKLQNDKRFQRFVELCKMMLDETTQENPNYAIIKQLLSVLLTMIEAERRKIEWSNESQQKTQHISFGNFLKILEENYKSPVGVEFYAEKLFMSSRNLNLICHTILEQSVFEIIETRKLIEAKNLLISTEKTISEIAYELGYNENSYFSNVFKKKSGQSPTEFREEMKNRLIS